MESNSETSDSYLVIITRKDRVKVFCETYWRTLLFVLTALVFLPVAFLGDAYACIYVFIVSCIYWMFDVLHPGVIALMPIALFSLMGYSSQNFIAEIHIHNGLLNCLGLMMIIIAIEYSKVHKRVAVKLLLIFGCSHYRLSFLLFFSCMFLSMWVSNTIACGLMIPLVKAILHELEKMGIIEIYHNIGKVRQQYSHHEQTTPLPTAYTIFYFLGIAYSSSIGGMSSLIGSQTNQIFKYNIEFIFPNAPKLEFPNFILLTLPGVLLMETILYFWLNFYFMGMFRVQSEMALEIGISEEESEYIQTLLQAQYNELGNIRFHEIIVSVLVAITITLQATRTEINGHITLWSPAVMCVVSFFVVPVNLDFLKFFRRRSSSSEEPFPVTPSRACLNWTLIQNNLHWSVLFVIAGSCTLFEALQTSLAVNEMEKLLLLMRDWPAPAQSLLIIIICKILTEFGPNSCVLHAVLPSIVKLSIVSKVNPLYLMTAATLSCAVPFHLVPGTPANAMVVDYMHIPPWKIMQAGLGPSLAAVVVIWFTTTIWARVMWPDINVYPAWASENTIFFKRN